MYEAECTPAIVPFLTGAVGDAFLDGAAKAVAESASNAVSEDHMAEAALEVGLRIASTRFKFVCYTTCTYVRVDTPHFGSQATANDAIRLKAR